MLSLVLLVSTITVIVVFVPQNNLRKHKSIIIWSDEDFNNYRFKGDGSLENPFLIQNYNIKTSNTEGIYIKDTTKYFRIENCLISAAKTSIYIHNVASGTVTVINNECTDSQGGILISSSSNSTIRKNNCHMNNHDNGITIENSPYSKIEENKCSFNYGPYGDGSHLGNGIRVKKSANTTLSRNICDSNSGNGISITTSPNSIIINNSLTDNVISGLFVEYSIYSSIINNQFYNNAIMFEDIINYAVEDVVQYVKDLPYNFLSLNVENNYIDNKPIGFYKNLINETIINNEDSQLFFVNCTNLKLENLNIENCYGTILYSCDNVIVQNCNFSGSPFIGFAFYNSENTKIINNVCNNNRWYGIGAFNSNGTLYQNNICINNLESGIIESNSCNNTIIDNFCNNNGGFCGINVQNSENNLVHNNTCIGQIRGFYSIYTYNITISNNTFSQNDYGMDIIADDFCVIKYNTITNNFEDGIMYDMNSEMKNSTFYYNLLANNGRFGIIILSGHNYTIHHNSFIDNNLGGTSQAYDTGKYNKWYDEIMMEGNFWSDWSGVGSYVIAGSADSVDPYPLSTNPLL